MTTNKQKEDNILIEYKDLIEKEDWQGFIDLLTDDKIAKTEDSNERAGKYFYRGNAYFKLKEYEKAIKDYNTAIGILEEEINNSQKDSELNQNLVNVYKNRGNAYFNLKKYKKAIKDYKTAIGILEKEINNSQKDSEFNPKLADTHNNRGKAYFNLKKYKKAIKDYKTAIGILKKEINNSQKDSEFNPKLADTHNNRGKAYFKLKEYKQAIKNYTATIVIYEEAINNNPAKASYLNPMLVDAYYNRGGTYDEADCHKTAIKDYIKIIKIINKGHEYIKKELLNHIIIRGYGSFFQKINVIKSNLEYKEIESLYHYSSKEAIDGIVFADEKNRYFAFTEANFLNDPTEGNFLLDIINIAPSKINKDVKKPFVACFATLDDDLNQWRLYGNDGNGANVGIEANEYLKSLKDKLKIKNDNKKLQTNNDDNTSIKNTDLLYSDNNQNIGYLSWSHICYVDKENHEFYKKGQLDSEIPELLKGLKKRVETILKNNKNKTLEEIIEENNIEDKDIEKAIEQRLKGIYFEDYVQKVVTEKLDIISCLFKHIAYKDEHEVRLVVPFGMIPNNKLNFDGYKVKWQAPEIPFNAIKSIKFGPNQNQDFKTYLLYKKEQTKENNNFKDIDISHSELPYKSKKQ